MSRLLDRATCNANHDRFVRRVIKNETVWYLKHPDGVANSVSNDDEETTILMFWSDRAYASRVRRNGFEDYKETSMDLFDFLYRWLPGMTGDGILAGTNWTGDLIGIELNSYELRKEIEERMPEELKQKHLRLYKEQSD